MRNLIIGAAALLAVAAPGAAAAQTGYVGGVYSNVDVDGFGDADVYGAEGAVAWGDGVGFELDAALLDADNADATFGLTGHIFSRNDRYLFGGFAGVASNDGDTTWQVGVEANAYFDRVTLAGAVAYAENDDANVDGIGVNTQARFFVSDNFRLQAELGWANVDGAGGDADAFSYGAGAEYQFDMIPVSVGLAYNRFDFDNNGPEADVVSVTARYNWGGTLFDRDRRGASQAGLSGITSLLGF